MRASDAAIPHAERRGALGVDDEGLGQGVEVVVADQAVVAQVFDAQKASVGGKADLPQGGEMAKSPTDRCCFRKYTTPPPVCSDGTYPLRYHPVNRF